MNTTEAMHAIDQSARTNSIVFLEHDDNSDTLGALKHIADDYVDVGQHDGTYTIELWGGEHEDEWRVHVTGVEL